jgi:ketosteroid isomerase-like protein
VRDWPETEYRGHDGFRRFLTEWLDVWDGFEVGVDDFIPAADERVVCLFWQRGKGRHSGLSMDVAWAMVNTVRGGRLARAEVYDDRSEALEAVGLEEEVSSNLDLVRSIYADWERGDLSSSEWAHPDVEFTWDGFGVFPRRTWKGLADVAEGVRSQIEIFEDFRMQAEEYRELDDHRVLALDRRSGSLKHSGIAFGDSTSLPMTGAHLFEIDGGKVTRLIAYSNRPDAFGDLGLEE